MIFVYFRNSITNVILKIAALQLPVAPPVATHNKFMTVKKKARLYLWPIISKRVFH